MYDTFPHFGRLATSPKRARLSRIIPLHLWYALRREVAMIRVRRMAGRVRRTFRHQSQLRVNIGPGRNVFPGWVNLDVCHAPGIVPYDCRKDLPFADQSVDAIYAEHVFEHFEYSHEAQVFLLECKRVIRPGGYLRLVVPDAGRFLRAYADPDPQALRDLTAGFDWFDDKWQTPMELINLIFRQGIEHHFAYDAETLCALLSRYGFTAHQTTFNVTAIPGFVSDTPERQAHSLYVEGVRASTS